MLTTKVRIALLLTSTLVPFAAYGAGPETPAPQPKASVIQHVFVIAMENHDRSLIIGNKLDAPYINNTLLPGYAQATHFNDELLQKVPSEPHYIWLEAGTNVFKDNTFETDEDPSQANSTGSTAHLVTQIVNAANGLTWMTYQEDQDSVTGSCPIATNKPYVAKHNPFVFFQDVSGNPPSKDNPYCLAHSKPFSSFTSDLAANSMANYVFITPNLCNDMHGDPGCPNSKPTTTKAKPKAKGKAGPTLHPEIKAGDDWLALHLPTLIDWVNKNAGVIFITWDEGEDTPNMPFLAIGPGVKVHHAGSVSYNHGSIIKSVEEIFNLPILSSVSGNNDLSELFKAGFFP